MGDKITASWQRLRSARSAWEWFLSTGVEFDGDA
jgi:hypothetical protein